MGELVQTRGAQALQYGSGQGDPHLRELICDVMALEGIEGSSEDVVVTVGSQQALDLVTRVFIDPATSSSPRPRRTSARWAPSPPTRPRSSTSRWTTRAWCPRRCARRSPACARRASARSSSTPSPTSTTRPARAWPSTAATRSSRSASRPGCWSSRTTRTACSASTRRRCRRSGARRRGRRPLPRLVQQDLRPGPARRLGAGAARRAEKLVLAAEAAVLCPPTFNQLAVAEYLATQDWQGRSRRSGRCTASGATRCSTRSRSRCRRARPGRSRPAASTSG
jgi:hypothetical protein